MLDQNPVNKEREMEQLLLEEELENQLALLKKEKPKATLFPEVEDPMEQLPHLKDGTMAAIGAQEQKLFMLEEAFLEENVAETIAFCTILAILMIAPQLI